MSHLLAAMHLLGESGPGYWILHELTTFFFPEEIKNLITGTFDSASEGVYKSIYEATRPAAMGIAAAGATVRGMKMLADPKTGGVQIITDVMTRSIVAFGLVQAGFEIVTTIFNVSMKITWQVFFALVTALPKHELVDQSVGTGAAGTVTAGAMIGNTLFRAIKKFANPWGESAAFGALKGFGWLVGGVAVIFVLYIISMIIARFLLAAMVIAMAPVCIALTVFEPKNRFTEWWVEALIGAALIPIVLAFSLGLTIALTEGYAQAFPLYAVILAPVVLIGGIWLTGKMMHKLTWRHFQHGGPIGAISAGFAAAWAIPQLAFEGHQVGKALGIRKDKEGNSQGLMGLGAKRENPNNPNEITSQGVLGDLLDVGISAAYGKQAAIYSYGAAEQHQKNKQFGHYAGQGGGTPADGVHGHLAMVNLENQEAGAANFMRYFNNPGTRLMEAARAAHPGLSDDALVGKEEGSPFPNGVNFVPLVPAALHAMGLAPAGTTTTSSTPAPAGGGPVAAPVTQVSPNSPPGERPVPAWAARDGVDLGDLRPGYGADAANNLNRER